MSQHAKAKRNPETNEYDKYAWPGLYPLFYVTTKNVCVCADCANTEDKEDTDLDKDLHGELDLMDANWEDPDLYCDICEERIESAYAEEEEEK